MSKKSRRRTSNLSLRTQGSSSEGKSSRASKSVLLKPFSIVWRMLGFVTRGLAGSKILLTLPLMLLLSSSLTDYLVLLHSSDSSALLFFSALPVPVDDPRRESAEALKRTVQAGLYLFALVLCIINWRAVYQYFASYSHLLLLFAILLFSATYSTEPTKVLTNSILILISVLMPLLFAIGQRDVRNKLYIFYLVFLIPFVVSHVASLGLLLFYDVNPFELIASPNRYGGFSGNPNSLGNSAALGMWAATALVLSREISFKWRVLGLLSIPLFLFSVALSGSGTATVASILVVALMVWMKALASFKANVRLVVNAFSAALFVCLILSVLLLVTPAELFLAFTGSLGKDATLTGRTELWGLAKDAITERPWLGWSFDSHASVMAERKYEVRYNHYHNGFMDTTIDGGIVLISLVLYNMGLFAFRFVKVFQRNDAVFTLLVPLIMIIVLNMSEYSLLRPLSEVWQLYMACFVVLTFTYRERDATSRSLSTGTRRKRSRRGMRWA